MIALHMNSDSPECADAERDCQFGDTRIHFKRENVGLKAGFGRRDSMNSVEPTIS
jgi:hypothetical protein